MRSQHYTLAEIKAKLPRSRDGRGFQIKGITCPYCHRLMDGSASPTKATISVSTLRTGQRLMDNVRLGGCGGVIYVLVNGDGVGFLSSEQWERMNSAPRTVWSRPEPE